VKQFFTDKALSDGLVGTAEQISFGDVGFNRVNGANFDGEKVFMAMQAAFERAMDQFPENVHVSYYVFGGRTVRIRIVGSQLAQHIPQPFSHLETKAPASNAPQLFIDLWDDKATNIRCYRGSRRHALKWTEVTGRSADGRFIGQLLPNVLTCFDRNSQCIVSSVTWHDHIFIYERAKPLARLLLEWYSNQQMQVVHAGLVARNGQGILFAGKSGAGKSTAALACLCGGFNYLGEDYIGLQSCSDGSFLGHSLYNSVFLETNHLTRFRELMPFAIKGRVPFEEKSVIILSRVFPERLERAVPIKVLILPRVVDTQCPEFRPASKRDTLLALGPSSLLQIPNNGLGALGFDRLAQLVERVPCYWLEVGNDLRLVAPCVDELLTKLSPL